MSGTHAPATTPIEKSSKIIVLAYWGIEPMQLIKVADDTSCALLAT
jgi:hypothetical protein